MTVDIEKLEALAKSFPELDFDSNTEPFFNGPSGESLGGGSTGFYCVYGQPFEIDGEQYDGNEYVSTCTKEFAKFMCTAKHSVLELIAELKCPMRLARHSKRLVEDLRAELAGLKTGYEAYERVNAELRAECEALQEKYEAARDRKNSITALQAENEALRDAAAVSAMRIKELDLLFGRYILAMRAAVIEDEHGKTETTGMDWIFNSLAGPGQLPPEGETDAQGYFDREIVAVDNGMQEVLAFHDQRRAAKSKESAQ